MVLIALAFSALLGSMSLVVWRQSRALEILRDLHASRVERAIVEAEGLAQVRDDDALARWVEEVVASSPGEAERFRGGEAKLMGFFVGQAMRRTGGRANPEVLKELLHARLSAHS